MPDRVKQAIFDMLASRYDSPGALPPLFVADVFAGGGSMGLEALSRGAAFCSFFERDLDALEALRGNIESLGAGQVSRVVAGDAWRAPMATPTELVREGILAPAALIFLDPPYRDCEDTSDRGAVRRFLERLVLRHSQTFGLGGMPKPGASDEPTEGQTTRPRRERPGGSAGHRHGQQEPTPVSVGSTEHFLQLGHATRLVVLHHPAGTRFVAGARIPSRTNSDDPWQVVEERLIGSNAVTFFAS